MVIGCSLPKMVQITSCKIKKDDFENLKNIIVKESYIILDRIDDVPHCADYGSFKDCYYLTRYTKKIESPNDEIKSYRISISFKKFDYPTDYYRNIGVTIYPRSAGDQAIDEEAEKMTNLIKNQLKEFNAECIKVE